MRAKTMRGPIWLAALAVLSAPAAQAQIAQDGGPISYSADNLEYADGAHQLVLSGDVDIVQGDARLRASRVTMFFAGSSSGGLASGDIQRMIAEGDVYYVRPTQQARGDRAVYETSTDTVTFTGNVVMASDDSVVRGEVMVMHVKQGTAALRPGGGQRVRGVFRPNSSGGAQ